MLLFVRRSEQSARRQGKEAERMRETHRFTSSNLGKNSFIRTTLSAFFPLKSILLSPSQSGSNGSTSVMYCSSRSCETPKEHSVRKVWLPAPPEGAEAVRVKLRRREERPAENEVVVS